MGESVHRKARRVPVQGRELKLIVYGLPEGRIDEPKQVIEYIANISGFHLKETDFKLLRRLGSFGYTIPRPIKISTANADVKEKILNAVYSNTPRGCRCVVTPDFSPKERKERKLALEKKNK